MKCPSCDVIKWRKTARCADTSIECYYCKRVITQETMRKHICYAKMRKAQKGYAPPTKDTCALHWFCFAYTPRCFDAGCYVAPKGSQ